MTCPASGHLLEVGTMYARTCHCGAVRVVTCSVEMQTGLYGSMFERTWHLELREVQHPRGPPPQVPPAGHREDCLCVDVCLPKKGRPA